MEPTPRLLFFLFTFLLFSFQGFSQKKLESLVNITGDKGLSIGEIHAAGKGKVLIDGIFLDEVVLGRDTLSAEGGGNGFLTWFEAGGMRSSMAFEGRIQGVGQGSFCIAGRQSISRYDFKNRQIWNYMLPVKDSTARSVWEICDIGFDETGNTYVLIRMDVKTYLDLKNEVITGPGNAILTIDSVGVLNSCRKIAERHTYNRLKVSHGRICAYGGAKFSYSALVLDGHLKEIQDDALKTLCRFSLWDGGDYFRIEETGKRPLRPFVLEKYNARRGVIEKEVFRDTLRFQNEIWQHDLLNMDKRNLLVAYTQRGIRTGNKYGMQIHLVVIRKKNLKIRKHLIFDCDHLYGETVYQFVGRDLLIASEYRSHGRIGDISFAVNSNDTSRKGFFIVKLVLN